MSNVNTITAEIRKIATTIFELFKIYEQRHQEHVLDKARELASHIDSFRQAPSGTYFEKMEQAYLQHRSKQLDQFATRMDEHKQSFGFKIVHS